MTIPFERQSGSPERRRRLRVPLCVEITARERSRTAMPARMVELSSFGARIEGMVMVRHQPGDALWMRLPGLESLSVRLVWHDLTGIGVEFDTPLHPAVTARFMPRTQGEPIPAAPADPGKPHDHQLLSRREQIVAGICASERSPLLRRKQPSGLGLDGQIVRMIRRRADHRGEVRYADPATEGTTLAIEGAPAEVLDMSASGMRVRANLGERSVGERILVHFEGFEELVGQVVWKKAGQSGISLPPQSIELLENV